MLVLATIEMLVVAKMVVSYVGLIETRVGQQKVLVQYARKHLHMIGEA